MSEFDPVNKQDSSCVKDTIINLLKKQQCHLLTERSASVLKAGSAERATCITAGSVRCAVWTTPLQKLERLKVTQSQL